MTFKSGVSVKALATTASATAEERTFDVEREAQKQREADELQAEQIAHETPPEFGAKFRSSLPFITYVDKYGAKHLFKAGTLHTEDANLISELRAAISSGNPHLREVK